MLYATARKLWLERNNKVFKNKSKTSEDIVDANFWTVSEWVIKKYESKGIPFEAINRFLSSLLQGRQSSKIVNRIMWIHPPYRVYKLKSDGSFL